MNYSAICLVYKKSYRLSNKQAVLRRLLTNCSRLSDLLTVGLILLNLINLLIILHIYMNVNVTCHVNDFLSFNASCPTVKNKPE